MTARKELVERLFRLGIVTMGDNHRTGRFAPPPPEKIMILRRFLPALFAAFVGIVMVAPATAQDDQPPPRVEGHEGDSFTQNEIVQAGANFFGVTTEAMAKGVQKVFSDYGLPDAYITGDEGSGAIVVGLRYGQGWLIRKGADPMRVYWQGPSVGWDFGGNASKMFVLIYNLREPDRIFQKFPGVDGSFYLVAGLGVNYMRANGITLAPMRSGVGLRAGVNAGYVTFTRHSTINPF
jgi:hypothetical protein